MMFSKPVIKLNAKVFSSTYGKTKEELLCDETVWGANMLTLEDDMLTVKTDAVRIIPARSEEFKGHTFFEGASIRKIGDTYYTTLPEISLCKHQNIKERISGLL